MYSKGSYDSVSVFHPLRKRRSASAFLLLHANEMHFVCEIFFLPTCPDFMSACAQWCEMTKYRLLLNKAILKVLDFKFICLKRRSASAFLLLHANEMHFVCEIFFLPTCPDFMSACAQWCEMTKYRLLLNKAILKILDFKFICLK